MNNNAYITLCLLKNGIKFVFAISVHMFENFINVRFTREILTLVLYFSFRLWVKLGFPGDSDGKESPAMLETWVQSLGWKNPLVKEMATHFNILAWRIPWTEEICWSQSVHGLAIVSP